MKRTVIGILAHVDAGKTTLSEALLYQSGAIRALGRVDHGDAFLDTDALERERGVTILSKPAVFRAGTGEEAREMTLLDTPGHADFSAETERVLRVLDCAVLVVSASEGVQSHTITLWRLLERYGVPVMLFLNKTDLAGADPAAALASCRERLDGACVDFTAPAAVWQEEAALCGEDVLERYLETGTVSAGDIRELVSRRKLFPCFSGSALRMEGIEEFLEGLCRYLPDPAPARAFGARVYKISRDAAGVRLTWMKITGGSLRVKTLLTNRREGLPDETVWEEKADQLRIYSGAKYRTAEEVPAGTVCAAAGLRRSRAGDGLGFEGDWTGPALKPVLRCQVLPLDGTDPRTVYARLKELEEEDPQLHTLWQGGTVQVQLMGEVQKEVLQRRLRDRYGMDTAFGPAAIVYRETIAAPAEGVGHFEPLRHYAEVRLRLEPLPAGRGVELASECPEDRLARNWQRLILSMLAEKEHAGVLTGAPLTDVRIVLTAGRAHQKHTEGGDFREAAWRAVRQGLMGAENVLLEPWYAFRLTVPASRTGRAMTDFRQMRGEVQQPETTGDETVLTGAAPVSALRDYAAQIAAYTGGLGRLELRPAGFRPCGNQAEIVAASGYDPERDTDNPSASVFCSHGAGYVVPWYEVPEKARTESGAGPEAVSDPEPAAPSRTVSAPADFAASLAREKELQAIFERTYGPAKERRAAVVREARPPGAARAKPRPAGPEYLLVDGYNIIFAWEELTKLARESLDAARTALCDLLCGYQGIRGCAVIAVFDAYKVKNNPGSHERYHNIHVVYTKEAETADAYIERASYELGKEHRVRVATSDGPEQLIILGHGAERVSASMFYEEMREVRARLDELIAQNNRPVRTGAVRAAMERAVSGKNKDP